MQGLNFLTWTKRYGVPAILGDEMGLGKTIQTLALFQYLKESRSSGEPLPIHLVVCPLSILMTWIGEASRFTPGLKMLKFHGPDVDAIKTSYRAAMKNKVTQYDCIVTTYETVEAQISWLSTLRFSYVVLDEGHKIKNKRTKIAQASQKLKGQQRLLLTG